MIRQQLTSGGLLDNTDQDAVYQTALRFIQPKLGSLRDEARAVDNYDAEGEPALRPSHNYTSVEALVMDVSDLAQAYGWLKARMEDA